MGFANMGTDLDDLAAEAVANVLHTSGFSEDLNELHYGIARAVIACVEKYHTPIHAIEVVAVARPQTCPYCGGTPSPNTFLSR